MLTRSAAEAIKLKAAGSSEDATVQCILEEALEGTEVEVVGITGRHPLGWWGDGTVGRVVTGEIFVRRKPGFLPVQVPLTRASNEPGAIADVVVVGIRATHLRLRGPALPDALAQSDEVETQAVWDAEVGLWHNTQLDAPNVWEFSVPSAVVDEAAALFEQAGLRKHFADLREGDEWRAALQTPVGGFFAMRAYGRRGDVHCEGDAASTGNAPGDLMWISVDDMQSYTALRALFVKMDIERHVAKLVEHKGALRLFSAFFVVRTRCGSPTFHTDWKEVVGTNALTLMTPLSNFPIAEDARGRFQLLYRNYASTLRFYYDELGEQQQQIDPADGVCTYPYCKGRAIVFGSNFLHSTEPGHAASPDEPSVYLCFEFGSDEDHHWPNIKSTIGQQTRLLARFDGQFVPGHMDVNNDAPLRMT